MCEPNSRNRDPVFLSAQAIPHIDVFVQGCSISIANAKGYCSIAINRRYLYDIGGGGNDVGRSA